MTSDYLQIELRTSPHASRGVSVVDIMRNVVYALLPIVLWSVYVFGLSALLLIATSTAACLLTEELLCRRSGKDSTLGDWSALITGLLLGLTLPPGFPLWMTAIGGVVAIALGKELFGGLGFNVFNPALVGRAFLQAAFPAAITTWVEPFRSGRFLGLEGTTLTLPLARPLPAAMTGATPLSAVKFDHQSTPLVELFMGSVSGSLGETSTLLILLCAAYLAWRKMLDWRIPSGIFATVFVVSGAFYLCGAGYPSPLHMLFSGGLMLGACFMATDMVTSPVTALGTWLYAVIVGVLIVVIRLFGGLPEGVMYAILLGNGLTPVLHTVTQPRVYGSRGGVKTT